MKKNKLDYIPNKVVNVYIVYKLNDLKDLEDSKVRNTISSDFTIQSALFGALKITKDVDTSNYSYSGYGICFDSKSDFSIGNVTNGQNVIIFGADMSLVHILKIGQIIFMFWVNTLFKVLMEQQCMQKDYTKPILLKKVKKTYIILALQW